MGPQDTLLRPPAGGHSAWGSPASNPMHRKPLVAGRPRTPPAGVPLRAPTHPGRFLARQYLTPLGINQTQAAGLLGVSRRRINELIMGHRAMSADTAVRCAMVFGASATFWLGLQARWDAWQAWRDLRLQMVTAADPSRLPPAPALSGPARSPQLNASRDPSRDSAWA